MWLGRRLIVNHTAPRLLTSLLGLLGLVMGLILTATDSKGQDLLIGTGKREALRNLTGVEVVVESLHEEGLAVTDLQAEVESQLEGAGIRVLRDGERLTQPGFPYLYVRVAILHTAAVSSYLLELSLNQTVTLTRQPTLAMFAPTWSVEAVGVLQPFDPQRIRDAVHDYVARFIAAYQAANPRDDAFP